MPVYRLDLQLTGVILVRKLPKTYLYAQMESHEKLIFAFGTGLRRMKAGSNGNSPPDFRGKQGLGRKKEKTKKSTLKIRTFSEHFSKEEQRKRHR